MKKAVTQEQMKQCDNNAIESGIPSLTLMENAAKTIVDEFCKVYTGGRIAVICGGGNNGGDGATAARLLLEKGITCDVYFYFNTMSADCKINFEKLQTLPLKLFINKDIFNYSNYSFIIDALFGTGINREVSGIYKQVIDGINNSKSDITSIDMPSGLPSSFKTNVTVVKANRTISLAAYKYGQLFAGLDVCGDIIVKDINIAVDIGSLIYEKEDIKKFFKKRAKNTHKGSYGKLCIIAGSGKYFGAAIISYNAAASLRAGAGLTMLAVPRFLAVNYRNHIKESVLEYLPDNGENTLFNYSKIKKIMENYNTICIGMGMGCNEETYKICKTLVNEYDKKLLLDADALNSIAKYNKKLFETKHNCDIVITPHLKEFSRLTSKSIDNIKSAPLLLTQNYAIQNNVCVLLKGASTIITDKNCSAINITGTPAMAKAGSGDILSGIIGGICAQGECVFNSAVAGAFIHGKAGELAQKKLGQYSVIASDICENIALVIKDITKE